MTTLHRCGYKYDEALKEMNANDKLLSADANFMTVDDTKKFGKGIKTYGKNFVKISRELLPMHSRVRSVLIVSNSILLFAEYLCYHYVMVLQSIT